MHALHMWHVGMTLLHTHLPIGIPVDHLGLPLRCGIDQMDSTFQCLPALSHYAVRNL